MRSFPNENKGTSATHHNTYLVGEISLVEICFRTHRAGAISAQCPTNILGILVWNYPNYQFFLIAWARYWISTKRMLIPSTANGVSDEIVAVSGARVHARIVFFGASNPPGRNANVIINTFSINICFSDKRATRISLTSVLSSPIDG